MERLFPADVSLRLKGTIEEAGPLLGIAKNLLFKAQHLHVKPGAPEIMRMTQDLPGGGSISVLLSRDLKIVDIVPSPQNPVEEEFKQEQPKVEEVLPTEWPSLLNGWTRNPTVVADADGVNQFASYRPTPATAAAYRLLNAWQTTPRLADNALNPTVSLVWASMYSGAMKRVVQAIMGLGIFKDASPSYWERTVVRGPRTATIPYQSGYSTTHGVYKAAAKNFWLIEISVTRGVLAMPLPLLEDTTTARFRAHLVARNDVDTLRVVDEFGGIPSGETLPTDANLTAMITKGEVLRLLTSTELELVYKDHSYWHQSVGWAFSAEGTRAHLTNYQYAPLVTGYVSIPAGTVKRELHGDHFRIDISLSPHNRGNVPNGLPVGSGSATVGLVHSGLIDTVSAKTLWFTSDGRTRYNPFYWPYFSVFGGGVPHPLGYWDNSVRPWKRDDPGEGSGSTKGWGADVHVFFDDDDRLVRVKYTHPYWDGSQYQWLGYATTVFDLRSITVVAAMIPARVREGVIMFSGFNGFPGAQGRGYFTGVGVVGFQIGDAQSVGGASGSSQNVGWSNTDPFLTMVWDGVVNGSATPQYLMHDRFVRLSYRPTYFGIIAAVPTGTVAANQARDLPPDAEVPSDMAPGKFNWVGSV